MSFHAHKLNEIKHRLESLRVWNKLDCFSDGKQKQTHTKVEVQHQGYS